MISIQHSLTDTQHASLVNLGQHPDNDNSFETVLNAVAVEKMPIEESEENLPTLKSDSHVHEHTLATHSLDVMISKTAHSEQIQSTPVNLTREHSQKETPADSFVLKKSRLKATQIDGTEVDPSMMIPLVPINVRSNSVTLISYEPKDCEESLQVGLNGDDALEPSINLIAIDAYSVNPTYAAKVDSRNDVNNAATHALNGKEALIRDEDPQSLSFSKENISHDHAAELIPTTQAVHGMTDQTIMIRPASAKMIREIQSNEDDILMDEVPIVSIALKRDPVMRDVPLMKSDLDPKPKNENVGFDHTPVSTSKILADITQSSKDTNTDSFENDFEVVEPSQDNPLKGSVLNFVQSASPTESSEITANVSVSNSASTQQIQHAILDAKEGIHPKESKTLTVILNPEELGVVNVELTADETGKLSAVLSVEKRETLDVLQHDLHQLKTVLKEIGIDESSISLQLSSNNEQGQQKQSEYIAWEEREQMLMRSPHIPMKTAAEKATYPERPSLRRLDIKA
ncbi:flagellar hook-length control protein FliK [Candidatus Bodocaedibacter vickermanii]|uniref:Flagellar hook-length control protein FliK n=1 Tax=Candidatus Bodocaedibacter vickermanii TaxID=2741701 RepID=A0A7L9RRZ1_9PROT|nr:Flagellar hook-length control protein FliK [Candidatus Paracaedibacteraceae bacterium 'Lake Konstanz']